MVTVFWTYDDAGDIARLEPRYRQFKRLEHAVVDSLADETVEVDGTTQKLNVTLSKKCDVTVWRRSVDEWAKDLTFLSESRKSSVI